MLLLKQFVALFMLLRVGDCLVWLQFLKHFVNKHKGIPDFQQYITEDFTQELLYDISFDSEKMLAFKYESEEEVEDSGGLKRRRKVVPPVVTFVFIF